MNKEKRQEHKEKLVQEISSKISEKEMKIANQRKYFDEQIRKEEEELEILRLQEEALKKL